jgi:glycosyltransferase involved in cell wall biosynthesis
MRDVIDCPEKLWRACANISASLKVTSIQVHVDPNDHFVLAYGPVAKRNQFQTLLYSARDKFNVAMLPVNKLDLCGEIPWPCKLVVHFHWLHGKTSKADTVDEADQAVVYWSRLIRRIKENGHKIVWTVHNAMPHETVWVEQDCQIHQMMADAADALHIMASDSVRLTEKYYRLDERKIFVVPHPTYEGAQPDETSREDARRQLQIDEKEFVFLSFGAIMEYKGYHRLMSAFDQLRGRTARKTRLIIAGLPSHKPLVEKIADWGEDKPDVLLDMTAVPHEKLQLYFRLADFAVCPYYRTMNSGAAMMAISFDLPVLGPNCGSFLDLEKSGCGITFDNTNDAALVEKMRFLIDHKVIAAEKLVKAKQILRPSVVSELFFNEIRRVVT